MNEPKLVKIHEAAVLADMNLRTFRRRVSDSTIPTIRDPRDLRRKLIRVSDLREYCGEVGLKQAS